MVKEQEQAGDAQRLWEEARAMPHSYNPDLSHVRMKELANQGCDEARLYLKR